MNLQRIGLVRLVVMGMLFCAEACGGDGVAMRHALETEHFVVLMEEGLDGLPDACPALGEWLEGYYNVFESYLEVHRPTQRKITYKIFGHLDAARSACNGAGIGCYFPDSDTIVSVVMLHPHEIGHVFETLVGGRGNGPRFFSEAMASALGGGFGYSRSDHRVDSSLPVEDLLDDRAFLAYVAAHGPEVVYSTAAGFVHYLIDTLGKETFLAFFGALDGASQRTAISETYSTVVGGSLDDAIQAWRDSPQPIVEDLQLVSAGCAISPVLYVGQSFEVDSSCAQRGFRFEVPSTGRQDIVIQSTNALVTLRSCDRGDLVPGPGIQFAPGRDALHVAIDAPPGQYEGIVTQGVATIAIPSEPVTLDLDGACSASRVPAEIGGPSGVQVAVVRRWGSTEELVAFDVVVRSSGALEIDSADGGGVFSGENTTAPRVFYLCPQMCATEPSKDCARDDIFEITGAVTPMDPLRDVFGVPIAPDQLLHFETGPRYQQDWSYSVRLRVAGP